MFIHQTVRRNRSEFKIIFKFQFPVLINYTFARYNFYAGNNISIYKISLMLYPLKFKPILKQTIWGGDKLAYKSNDPKVKESIGESWEISGVQDNISVVSEGALEGNL